jgi:hypothetical protein
MRYNETPVLGSLQGCSQWRRGVAGSQWLIRWQVGESWQAGSSGQRRQQQELLRMAVVGVNAVSGGNQGWVAGIGDVLYQALTIVYVPGGGVNRAAVGNQLRLRPRDHRHLTSGCT